MKRDSPESGEEMFVATIDAERPGPKDWHATVMINEKPVSFKLDTGAQCNVKTYNSLSKEPLQKSHAKLAAFGGQKLKASGTAHMACEYKGKYSLVDIEHNVPSILGLPTCTEMRLVQRIDSIQKNPADIIEEFKDVFDGLGCIKGTKHHIRVNPNHPTVINPPCRVPVLLKRRVKEEQWSSLMLLREFVNLPTGSTAWLVLLNQMGSS